VLKPKSEGELAEMDADFETVTGEAIFYILNGRSISLYRVPSESIQVRFSYQRRPLALVNDGDIPELPFEWHPIIMKGAIAKAMQYEDNPNYSAALSDYYAMIKQYSALAGRRLDVTSVFKSEDTVIATQPVARPTLPSNYPRP
jgi:hypothetical protein